MRVVLICILLAGGAGATAQTPLQKQNELLFQQLQEIHGLSADEMRDIRAIFTQSNVMGQGNPAVTQHPVTPQECAAMLQKQSVKYGDSQFERICGGKYMAPLFKPKTTTAEHAKACIDQFEFPNIPCVYPVVWVKAREAAQICEAEGKRLCDAHEWEGGMRGEFATPRLYS